MNELLNGINQKNLQVELNKTGLAEEFEVVHFKNIDSTNRWLSHNINPAGLKSRVCVADRQTGGVGRSGRSWDSTGQNISFSFTVLLPAEVKNFSSLSLVIGVVIVRVLRSLGVKGVGLKWPNDILLNNRKLAGVLIEVKNTAIGRCLIIGVGINVLMPESTKLSSALGWNDLSKTPLGVQSREKIIALILNEALVATRAFFKQGLSVFREEWMSYDEWAGAAVEVFDQGNVMVAGIEAGIDNDGRLLLETPDRIVKVQSGDVSLRIQHDN